METFDISQTTILIVEDNPVTRITLNKILNQAGYHTIEATNGDEGFNMFKQHQPDLVLMDIMMPIIDGYETVKAIRRFEVDQSVPILMLTSLDTHDLIEKAFESGATDFITKPINWGLLAQRVKYALRSSKTEQQLRTSQSQLIYAQTLAKLGYWEWDAINDEVTGSQSAFSLFGLPNQRRADLKTFIRNVTDKDKPIIHQAISELNSSNKRVQISFRAVQTNSDLKHIECLGEATFDQIGNLLKITGTAQDISRLHNAESLIEFQAEHDTLTELPNRTSFSKTLTSALQKTQPNKVSAVVVLDIDRFKKINESLGQELGDNLLLAIAKRLNRITRENDHVARLGSDEFVAFLQNMNSISDLNILINRFHQQLLAPFVINGKELYISYSIGISVYPDDADSAETLINDANIARTTAKKAGGNQFVFYKPEMNENAHDLLRLENDLRKALKNNEIEVFYQPQVYADTLHPKGSEALARWRHPKKGIISPTVFIPLAESTGLICDIGEFVLKTALEDTEKWHQQGQQLHVSVNISGRQFIQTNFTKKIQDALTKINFDPSFLALEITESLAMSNAEDNIQTLKALKAMGVSLAIDDFGTGYSSLAYLHSFPIDTIKIDRSFVINLDSQEGEAIARTILAMASSLNLEVVAEGIEDEKHVDFFKQKHCHIFQGFKFGKPMPAQTFEDWLKRNTQ